MRTLRLRQCNSSVREISPSHESNLTHPHSGLFQILVGYRRRVHLCVEVNQCWQFLKKVKKCKHAENLQEHEREIQ